jgi:hypothetical protein
LKRKIFTHGNPFHQNVGFSQQIVLKINLG